MSGIHIDQFVNVGPECPIGTDNLPADETVQVVIGTRLARGTVVRVCMSDKATCERIAAAFTKAAEIFDRVEPDDADQQSSLDGDTDPAVFATVRQLRPNTEPA